MNEPKSFDELKKLRLAEAMKSAESQAAKEWEQINVRNEVRDFVERHGGAAGAISLIEHVYGLRPSGASKKKKVRRRRSVITEELRARIEKLLREKKTARVVAEAVGVSIPTVNNHKRSLGLTRPRDVAPAKVARHHKPKSKK